MCLELDESNELYKLELELEDEEKVDESLEDDVFNE